MTTLDFYLIRLRPAQAAECVWFLFVSTPSAGVAMQKPFSLPADNEWVKIDGVSGSGFKCWLIVQITWQLVPTSLQTVSVSSLFLLLWSFKGTVSLFAPVSCHRGQVQQTWSGRAVTCQHRGLSPDFTVKNNSKDPHHHSSAQLILMAGYLMDGHVSHPWISREILHGQSEQVMSCLNNSYQVSLH